MILFRLIIGVVYAVGGWQTATGLRRGDDAIAWQGVTLIVGGIVAEAILKWWRLQRPTPVAEDDSVSTAP